MAGAEIVGKPDFLDPEPPVEITGYRPLSWPWWSIRSAHDQNVTADLEFIRMEIERVKPLVRRLDEKAVDSGETVGAPAKEQIPLWGPHSPAAAAVLRTCEETLAACIANH